MTSQVPVPNEGPKPDMILGVRYQEYKPETYKGIELEPLGACAEKAQLFFSDKGFDGDMEDVKTWLRFNKLTAVCRSSFDHYQSDRKSSNGSL